MNNLVLVTTGAVNALNTISPSVSTRTNHAFGVKHIPGTNYSVKILTASDDLRKIFSLRYEVFCIEKGIVSPTNYPNHMETDEYDDNSIHLAITENDEFVGYTRLVLPCEKFPLERSNVLPSCFERSRSVETSRALVIKEKRHSDIVWHLFNSVYRFCQDIDFANILSFSNAVMYNGYKKRGVPFSYVGEPVLFHGHKSYPLVIAIHPGSYDFTQKQQLVKH